MTITSWKEEGSGDLKYEVTITLMEMIGLELSEDDKKFLKQCDNSPSIIDKISGLILVAKKIEKEKLCNQNP